MLTKVTKVKLKSAIKNLDGDAYLNVKILPRTADCNSVWYRGFHKITKQGVKTPLGYTELDEFLIQSEKLHGKLAYYIKQEAQ